jgi:ribosomal-protein-alanine N-acetyltransferase
MTYELRPWRMEDTGAIADLYNGMMDDVWSATTIEASFDSMQGIVCEKDHSIKGALVWQEAADQADIISLVVDPLCRRQGIGRSLMGSMLQQTLHYHITTIFLEVDQGNQAAIALYNDQGFNIVGERPHYYKDKNGHQRDAFVLCKSKKDK